MKLYKALIGNQYVQGVKYIVHMNVQKPDSTTTGDVRLTYEVKSTPSLTLLAPNGYFIKCFVEIPDGMKTKKADYGREQCYTALGVVELVKGNVQDMLSNTRDEKKANEIFINSSLDTDLDALLKVFGSFRFLNSTIVFNLPASMLQVLWFLKSLGVLPGLSRLCFIF